MIRFFRQGRKTILFILILCATAIGMTSFGIGMYGSPTHEKPAIKVGDVEYSRADVYRERRNIEQFYRNNFGGVFGDIANQVVDGLVDRAAQDYFLAQYGFESGKKESQKAILSLFGGQSFSPQMFNAVANSMGYSASEYEELISKEVRRNSFGKLLEHVSKPSEAELRAETIKVLRKYTIKYIDFPFNEMSVPEPTSEELESYFLENATKYELPRRVSYKWKELTDAKNLVEITNEDIEFYYAENESSFRTEPMIRADIISFPLDPSDPEKNREKADSVLAKINAGADFIDMVLKYSPNQKSGFQKKSDLPSEVAKKAFSIGIGQVSDVIRDPTGFYIIKVNEIKESESKPLDSVKDEIIKKIQDEQLPIYLAAKLDSLSIEGAKSEELVSQGNLTKLVLSSLPEIRQLHEVDGKFILLEVTDTKEPELPGLSEVKSRVLEDLKKERQEKESLRLAKEPDKKSKRGKSIEGISLSESSKEPLANAIKTRLPSASLEEIQEPIRLPDGYSAWWVTKITDPTDKQITDALKDVEEKKRSESAQKILKELTERVKANTVVDISPMVFAE